jgi:hypothetical protein
MRNFKTCASGWYVARCSDRPGVHLVNQAWIVSFMITVMTLSASPVRAQPTVSAADPRLQYWGRWDLRHPAEAGAITVNTGSTILIAFTGPGAVLHFGMDHYPAELPTLWLRIDDGAWRVVRPAESLRITDAPLDAGRHVVRLVVKGFREWDRRWEPPLESSLVFRGMTLDAGAKLLDPPARPKHVIEYFGDSITEGVLTHYDGRKAWERPLWPDYSDGRQGWAYQSARRVGAEPRVVGFGRLGLTIGGNGGVPVAIESCAEVYHGVPVDRSRQPDAATVGRLYAAYLERIRRLYPNARLLALQPFNGAHGRVIERVVRERVKAGDARVTFVDTTGWITSGKHTSDAVHLNVAGHERAAEQLVPFLRRTLAD